MWQPESFRMAVLSSCVFGLIGVMIMVIGFKVFDIITPKIDIQKELAEKHNIAVAIVMAAIILGIAMILHAVLASPTMF